jgi:hypothetical protein
MHGAEHVVALELYTDSDTVNHVLGEDRKNDEV